MDNNNQINLSVSNTPINPTPVKNPVELPPTKSGNGIIWVIVAIVVVILVATGLYLYSNQKNSATPVTTTNLQPAQQENLETEVNSIDVKGVDTDFDAVDKDLQNL